MRADSSCRPDCDGVTYACALVVNIPAACPFQAVVRYEVIYFLRDVIHVAENNLAAIIHLVEELLGSNNFIGHSFNVQTFNLLIDDY